MVLPICLIQCGVNVLDYVKWNDNLTNKRVVLVGIAEFNEKLIKPYIGSHINTPYFNFFLKFGMVSIYLRISIGDIINYKCFTLELVWTIIQ